MFASLGYIIDAFQADDKKNNKSKRGKPNGKGKPK